MLGYRAEMLAKVGDLDAAEASAREAVAIGRAVEGSAGLRVVLSRLAQILRDQHRHDEAARLGAEHAQVCRAEVVRDPTKAQLLLTSLRLRVHDLVAVWRPGEAIPDVEEALDVSRRLRDRDAGAGADELARSLRVAARAYAAADRLDQAVAALRALRDLARGHPTALRTDLAREAFTEALREAPQTYSARGRRPSPTRPTQARVPTRSGRQCSRSAPRQPRVHDRCDRDLTCT